MLKVGKAALFALQRRNELMKIQQIMLLFTSLTVNSIPVAVEYMMIMRQRASNRLRLSVMQNSGSYNPSPAPASQPNN